MNETWLAHHGVLGMKWGVRRYQNKDGSYTKRGLEHYRDTEQRYQNADQAYKTTKQLYKETKKNGYAISPSGDKIAVSKNVVKEAKEARKQAKRDLSKNYDQLKKDYLADQGRELYRSGKTITGAATNLDIAGYIALGDLGVSSILARYGKTKEVQYVTYAAIGLQAVNAVVGIKNELDARKLRAYYSHKGEYA